MLTNNICLFQVGHREPAEMDTAKKRAQLILINNQLKELLPNLFKDNPMNDYNIIVSKVEAKIIIIT